MPLSRALLPATLAILLGAADAPARGEPAGDAAEAFTRFRNVVAGHCTDCHSTADPEAKLDLEQFTSLEGIVAASDTWRKIARRVQDGEMPPEGSPPLADADREWFVDWIERTLHDAACGDGITPAPAPLRRLNRHEYAATISDLLDVHFNAGHALPVEGAGGEGFDNAAETLFISPVHAEKFLEAAQEAIDYALKDPGSRRRLMPSEPSGDRSPADAARESLARFLPRAFRRPVSDAELDRFCAMFSTAVDAGEPFEEALAFALTAALVSPEFLFHIEPVHTEAGPRLLDDYALASRLSYFLWGSMPDEALFELAAAGKLNDPAALGEQAVRMLKDRRAQQFAQPFVEQWLGTREIGQGVKPDRERNRRYDDEMESAIKYEPVLFFQHILAENRPLTDLLDADYTFLNDKVAGLYNLRDRHSGQDWKRTELPDDGRRGGLLGMSAVLTVSSYPHRTSPVLRGKWLLETLLGEPPPPPPPDVPPLDESAEAAKTASVRERLLAHRANPTCASCHDRIDPLGFGLDNYDELGRWRDDDAGASIDASGALPDGTEFSGPVELKAALVERQDRVFRVLASKMLGFALARGLTAEDHCAVDAILERLAANGYHAHDLVVGIVTSVPFRWQAGPNASGVSRGL